MPQQLRKTARFRPVATGETTQLLGIAQVEAPVTGHQKLASHRGLRFKQLHLVAGFGQALGRQESGRTAANYCDLARING